MKVWITCLLSLIFTLPALAQTGASPYANSSGKPSDASLDAQSGNLDIFSLVHRANLANTKTFSEFKQNSGQELDDAVAKFRARTPLRISPAVLQAAPTTVPAAPTTPPR